jgi:protein-disulfide isomerase
VQLIAQDKDVRIVFKEIPILRESSHIAARISHAVNQLAPEKYWDFHTKAMQYPGSASEANYLNVAESVGLDRTKVKAKMSDPKINGIIQRDLALAQKLNIRGTPAMIIDGKLSPGYIRLNQIKSQIDAARRG